MKAVVCTRYGSPDVLELQNIAKPEPKGNEVIIKVHAASVTAGDCEMRRFQMPVLFWLPIRLYMGIFKPRKLILGQEFSGVIESVGAKVSRFSAGDAVFGSTTISFGGHAEYLCLSESGEIAMKPSNMSFEEATAVPVGGFNALHFIRKSGLSKGQSLLVNGACGSIGLHAVQIAKSMGLKSRPSIVLTSWKR